MAALGWGPETTQERVFALGRDSVNKYTITWGEQSDNPPQEWPRWVRWLIKWFAPGHWNRELTFEADNLDVFSVSAGASYRLKIELPNGERVFRIIYKPDCLILAPMGNRKFMVVD
jgi:hypothetical protein